MKIYDPTKYVPYNMLCKFTYMHGKQKPFDLCDCVSETGGKSSLQGCPIQTTLDV